MINNIEIFYKDSKFYNLSIRLLLPKITINRDLTSDIDLNIGYLKRTEISFNNSFCLTNTKNSTNIEVTLLGFGIGFSIRTKESV